jgi:hypothetical protein
MDLGTGETFPERMVVAVGLLSQPSPTHIWVMSNRVAPVPSTSPLRNERAGALNKQC